MPRLIIAPAAERDLIEIGNYIALDDPSRALSFVAELENMAQEAGEHPERFPARDDIAPGLRVARHRRYLLFFTHQGSEVRIVRVLHGARDLGRLLGDER